MSALNLHLAISKDRDQGFPRHWVLILAEENATHGIFHHVTGGPIHDQPYQVVIEPKRIESHGIEKSHFIAKIPEKDKNKIKAAVQRAPPLFCQKWVLNVLEDLENRGVIPEGTLAQWNDAMEADPFSENDGPSTQPKASSSEGPAPTA
ncbi:hypothetical protein IL306_012755 [Fusarium sp. DS 682]|nr:hypothetical protein IL306_012755 [Fusarium sp. DS 682]